MRILILVLSCKKPPYDTLYEAQRATWDSIEVPGVVTRYFWCDEVAAMPGEFRRSLDGAVDLLWDFVFRTNSSSYIDKARLKVFAESLPAKRCYCGIDGGGFASGSGFFLSRDTTEVLRRKLPDWHQSLIEDEVAGKMLTGADFSITPGAERVDYWARLRHTETVRDATEETIRNAYHVRCKSDTADRTKDLEAFEVVHKMKGF